MTGAAKTRRPTKFGAVRPTVPAATGRSAVSGGRATDAGGLRGYSVPVDGQEMEGDSACRIAAQLFGV